MDEGMKLDMLSSENSHHAALNIINQLGDCQTREALNQVIKTMLASLLDCSCVLYACLQKEHTIQFLGNINRPSFCANSWQYFLQITQQTRQLAASLTSGLTTRVASDKFACGISSHLNFFQANNCSTVMAMFDALNPTFACYFCRINAQEQPFSSDDLNLLQLLRPSLLQAIRAVILDEEYKNMQQVIRQLSDHTEPLVIVRDDGVLMYQSDCFEKTILRRNNALLLEVLAHTKTNKFRKSASHRGQVKLGKRQYQVILTQVYAGSGSSMPLYLIRFLRTNKINGSIFCQLRKAGLTHREQEISVMLYQGIPTRDISKQTKISYHTVRNHIKSIYNKMDVSTRSEMLAMVG